MEEKEKEMEWNEESLKKFREYQNAFIKNTYKAYTIRFNREKEKNIIDFLEKKGKTTDYIRKLIEKDLEKEEGLIEKK